MPTPFVAGTGAPELSADDLDLEFDEAPELEVLEAEAEATFAELGASQGVIAALAAQGIISPFEIQARVIPDAIAGHDILAKSRTGSGTILVLDEADRLLDMGFKPQVDRIAMTIPTTDRQTMFFSATLDGEVGMLASQYTREPRRHETISPRETVDSVAHRFVPVTMETK